MGQELGEISGYMFIFGVVKNYTIWTCRLGENL